MAYVYKIVVSVLCALTALLLLTALAVHVHDRLTYRNELQTRLLPVCTNGSAAQLDLSDMAQVCRIVIDSAR